MHSITVFLTSANSATSPCFFYPSLSPYGKLRVSSLNSSISFIVFEFSANIAKKKNSPKYFLLRAIFVGEYYSAGVFTLKAVDAGESSYIPAPIALTLTKYSVEGVASSLENVSPTCVSP